LDKAINSLFHTLRFKYKTDYWKNIYLWGFSWK